MSTETTVQNLKINKLTKAQYDTITPSATEAYELTDLSSILDAKQDILTPENAGNCIEIIGNALPSLPSAYHELTYLESDGSAYINSGVTPTVDTGIKIVYAYTASGSAAISGTYQNTNPRTDTLFISSQSGLTGSTLFIAQRGIQTPSAGYGIETIALNKKYTAYCNYKNSGTMGFGDATQMAVGSNGVYSYPILLFARYNPNTNNITASHSRIYSVQFTEGSSVSHNFVPVKRKSDNALGLYDLVTDTFLTNAGSGSFTAGAEVSGDLTINFVNNVGYITSSALSGYQTTSNLVTSVSASSTDAQYPSAKCVYDIIGNIESLLSEV